MDVIQEQEEKPCSKEGIGAAQEDNSREQRAEQEAVLGLAVLFVLSLLLCSCSDIGGFSPEVGGRRRRKIEDLLERIRRWGCRSCVTSATTSAVFPPFLLLLVTTAGHCINSPSPVYSCSHDDGATSISFDQETRQSLVSLSGFTCLFPVFPIVLSLSTIYEVKI
ncbi:hypothetical protein OPV22_019867 [Ensete ventricosum]|uniref:Uncharacterized protein n=1 Tax=Ensete ventricosum TaxID=4639 RepID=A0AAV8QLR2_ENSVE|nr:hypothetical protein OPV22_019867 [Ensete ventricosum]